MKIILCGLTGMGNIILKRLLRRGYDVILVLTRKEPSKFPFYREEQLIDLCRRKHIEYYSEYDWEMVINKLTDNRPCMLLVATFHRIIPREVINASHLSFNIHPSLLPRHRGRCPIDLVLAAKDKYTGVTAHFLTNTVDAGGILIQKKISIYPDDTKNRLIKKLYLLSGDVVDELLGKIESNDLRCKEQEDIINEY